MELQLPGADSLPSRRWLVRGGLALVVVVLLVPAAFAAVNPQSLELGPGEVTAPADEPTYVSVQGFHFAGYGDTKKPARLVAANEDAELKWLFDGSEVGARWFYEVDPLENGNLFVTSTYDGGTVVFEFDPETETPVWEYDMPGVIDTHNANLLADDRILVAHMRAYDGAVSHDRLYIEDANTDDEEWSWYFYDHFDNATAGGFDGDWTHVNDVNVLDDDERYVLTSPRDFDQVVVVDRETDEIVMRLGEDGAHDTLFEQHNPDYLERDDGTPVIVVADSGNDRVVEYERDCGEVDPRLGAGTPPEECEWELVWEVDGFNWPRDADRLPNGNTLVTDTLNHRVVEITPEGEVVWEFYAAWAPYNAERGEKGGNGPTMADHGVSGSYTVTGGGDEGPAAQYEVADAIADLGADTRFEERTNWFATRWAHHEPWFRPVWMDSWTFLSTALAGVIALGWAGSEVVVNRRRIADGIRRRRP